MTRRELIDALMERQRQMFVDEPECADFAAAEEYYGSLSTSQLQQLHDDQEQR